ncbi:MAG: class A beta-lactamase [Xanthomarina gelatinilytica]|uniref:class A beta-lactamase n=1 Tax=Xanthomarina gelatinilytica TaxID=1137281 RepID=UPI003A8859DC
MRKIRNSKLCKSYFTIKLLILTFLISNQIYSQNALEKHFEQIADTIKGSIGISALNIETGESISFNGENKFPIQCVYKFPIAMVMLHENDAGNFSLKDTIVINKNEYISNADHSPIRDKYPNGTKLTITDILEYNISQSNGTACDVLLRLLGGTEQFEKSVHRLGVKNIAITTTEKVQVTHDTIQYQNWSTPKAMNTLLYIFYKTDYLSKDSRDLLLKFMAVSNKWYDRRIKQLLPTETELAHKTGTARTYNGFTRATNDVGIITLLDGIHLAVSVFISDSYDSQVKRKMTIARVAKEAYDFWATKKK